MLTRTLLASAITLTVGSTAQAQDLTAWYDMVNDPQVMAAYRAGACGPRLTPEQFVIKWAASRGCTVRGVQTYINDPDPNAALQQAQAAYAQAMRAQQQGFANNRYQAGMQLGSWNYNYLPSSGTSWYR